MTVVTTRNYSVRCRMYIEKELTCFVLPVVSFYAGACTGVVAAIPRAQRRASKILTPTPGAAAPAAWSGLRRYSGRQDLCDRGRRFEYRCQHFQAHSADDGGRTGMRRLCG